MEEEDDRPFDKPEFHFLRNKGLFKLAQKKYNTNTDVQRTTASDIEIGTLN